jgi:hypothetical protein
MITNMWKCETVKITVRKRIGSRREVGKWVLLGLSSQKEREKEKDHFNIGIIGTLFVCARALQ